MIHNERRDAESDAAGSRHNTRRELIANSLKLMGAGAIAVAGTRWSAPVAAQDQGIGAGGRTGGDSGATSSLPAAQTEGIGAGGRKGGDGGRRRKDDAEAPGGVGGGGRSSTDPTVMAMPKTGIGIPEGGAASAVGNAAPLLLVAGAVGAASLAMKTRPVPAVIRRD